MEVVLNPLTRERATAIVTGGERPADWAPDFPSAPDVEVAARLLSGDGPEASPAWPWGPWLVRLADGTVAGMAGFHGPPASGVVELGYDTVPSHQGRGIATSTVRALLALAAGAGIDTVVAGTADDNLASQRVLEKCGFVPDGRADGERRWRRPGSSA